MSGRVNIPSKTIILIPFPFSSLFLPASLTPFTLNTAESLAIHINFTSFNDFLTSRCRLYPLLAFIAVSMAAAPLSFPLPHHSLHRTFHLYFEPVSISHFAATCIPCCPLLLFSRLLLLCICYLPAFLLQYLLHKTFHV